MTDLPQPLAPTKYMLTYFAIGPTEEQTYLVAHLAPGCKTLPIVLEHLNEQDARHEASRLNLEQAKKERKNGR